MCNLAKITAPHNSTHGIDSRLIGATFYLATTSVMWTFPFSSVVLVYTTPEYATSEAFQRQCSCYSFAPITSFGKQEFAIRKPFNILCCMGHFFLRFQSPLGPTGPTSGYVPTTFEARSSSGLLWKTTVPRHRTSERCLRQELASLMHVSPNLNVGIMWRKQSDTIC